MRGGGGGRGEERRGEEGERESCHLADDVAGFASLLPKIFHLGGA